MARFSYDEDTLVEDEHGDVTYDEAIADAVASTVMTIEMALWELVDDLEYIITAETKEPSGAERD